jgi:hypothetical protein
MARNKKRKLSSEEFQRMCDILRAKANPTTDFRQFAKSYENIVYGNKEGQ